MTTCMRSMFGVLLAVAFTVVASGPAHALDGKQLYTQKGCMGCHGAEGNKPIAPLYPKIGGQQKAYMLQQMKDIKSGARDNGQARVMRPMMAAVSVEEMEAIADYLSSVPCK